MTHRGAAIIFALLAAGAPGYAQPEAPLFKADSNLQSIAVSVTDKAGDLVHGLTVSDFQLSEDGRPRRIAFFGAESQPVSLAVVVDSSHSMDADGKLDQARRLLAPLIRRGRAEDEVLFMTFDDRVRTAERLPPERRNVLPPLRPATGGAGGTALFDAVASSLCQMRTAQNLRQAVVIVTDGADQHSRLTLEQLLELARSSSAQIFTVGFYSSAERALFDRRYKTITLASGREIDNPLLVFERLARESGAESFFPTSEAEFKKALDRITAVLDGQYTLAFYPEKLTGVRRIDVKVKRGAVRISARKTVGSDSGGEPVRFAATGCAVSPTGHPYPWESRTVQQVSGAQSYMEDFKDARTGWPVHGDTAAPPGQRLAAITSLRYAAGGYELSQSDQSGARGVNVRGLVAAYGPWWRAFRASAWVDAKWTRTAGREPISDFATGLLFHVSDAGYYAILLSEGKNPEPGKGGRKLAYTLVRVQWNGARSELIPWTFLKESQPGPLGHRLSVERRGTRIAVLVNGQPVSQVEDAAIDSGLVGFGLFGSGRAVFRHLSVEELQ